MNIDLPGVLAIIAEATDRNTALRVAEAFGGTVLWIPRNPREGCRLADVVGVELAQRIERAVGAGPVRVPSAAGLAAAERRGRVLDLRASGSSISQIARTVRLSSERVRQILRSA